MNPLEHDSIENDGHNIRLIREGDLAAIIKIDEAVSGHRREQHLTTKFKECLKDSGIVISLVAEIDGQVVGFIMGDLYYGEYGRVERSVQINTLGVHPDFNRQGIASSLLRQFMMNVKALMVTEVETIVDWDNDFELLSFFKNSGFAPSRRICLSYQLES